MYVVLTYSNSVSLCHVTTECGPPSSLKLNFCPSAWTWSHRSIAEAGAASRARDSRAAVDSADDDREHGSFMAGSGDVGCGMMRIGGFELVSGSVLDAQQQMVVGSMRTRPVRRLEWVGASKDDQGRAYVSNKNSEGRFQTSITRMCWEKAIYSSSLPSGYNLASLICA